jgi:hypothetical protein
MVIQVRHRVITASRLTSLIVFITQHHTTPAQRQLLCSIISGPQTTKQGNGIVVVNNPIDRWLALHNPLCSFSGSVHCLASYACTRHCCCSTHFPSSRFLSYCLPVCVVSYTTSAVVPRDYIYISAFKNGRNTVRLLFYQTNGEQNYTSAIIAVTCNNRTSSC